MSVQDPLVPILSSPHLTIAAVTPVVLEALAKVSLRSGPVSPTDELVSDLQLDSLDTSVVLVEIEETIGVEMPVELLVAFSQLDERPLRVAHLLEVFSTWSLL